MDNISIQEAAKYLGVKVSTIYNWVHERKIPYRKHGRRLVFNRQSLERWSKEREIQEGDQY